MLFFLLSFLQCVSYWTDKLRFATNFQMDYLAVIPLREVSQRIQMRTLRILAFFVLRRLDKNCVCHKFSNGLPRGDPVEGSLAKNTNADATHPCIFCFTALRQNCVLPRAGKQKMLPSGAFEFFAERMGFEPTIQLPIYKLSRLAPSTTRTPL